MVRTHEACGVGGIGPDLSIDLDQTLHNNRENLLSSQGVFQPVSEENGEGQGFTEFVRTGGGTGGLCNASIQFQLEHCALHAVQINAIDAHKFRSTCRASMRKERQGVSSAFWVLEPRERTGVCERNVETVEQRFSRSYGWRVIHRTPAASILSEVLQREI